MILSYLAQATSNCTLNGQPVDCSELTSKAAPFIGIGIVFLIIFLLLAVAAFVFWLLMLLHAIKHNSPDRTMWIVLLVAGFFFGFSFIAAVVYYFVEKKKAEAAGLHQSATAPAKPTNSKAR